MAFAPMAMFYHGEKSKSQQAEKRCYNSHSGDNANKTLNANETVCARCFPKSVLFSTAPTGTAARCVV